MTGLSSFDFKFVAAVTIFAATYGFVAIGKIPGYRIDRAGAALVGASLMVGLGVLTPEEAYRKVDFDTITLLLGMMIVVANLRVSGFFRVVSHWIAAYVRRPLALLTAIVLASGCLSAFLVNDTICLVLTPLVLDLVLRLKRDPLPYLLAIAMASNIGSVATITGNPQNMIIGSVSDIPYGQFTAALAPVAISGLVLTVGLIALMHRKELFSGAWDSSSEDLPPRYHRAVMLKTLIVMGVMVVAFFLGLPVAVVAIVGGAYLLLTRRVKPEKIYIEIDWPLLLMFVGLFIVIGGLEKVALTPETIAGVSRLRLADPVVLGGVTAVLSNIVSNVPAVLVLKPFVPSLPDPQRAWLVIAMAATFAGNFTLVGSVANLIVAQRASTRGVHIGFWPYFRVGAPLTLVTIGLGLWWL